MLDSKEARIAKERSARKEPLSDANARTLLRKLSSVTVAKGKKLTKLSAAEVKLEDLKGPTGNYRAPMLVKGKVLLVGFNEEALEDLL